MGSEVAKKKTGEAEAILDDALDQAEIGSELVADAPAGPLASTAGDIAQFPEPTIGMVTRLIGRIRENAPVAEIMLRKMTLLGAILQHYPIPWAQAQTEPSPIAGFSGVPLLEAGANHLEAVVNAVACEGGVPDGLTWRKVAALVQAL